MDAQVEPGPVQKLVQAAREAESAKLHCMAEKGAEALPLGDALPQLDRPSYFKARHMPSARVGRSCWVLRARHEQQKQADARGSRPW